MIDWLLEDRSGSKFVLSLIILFSSADLSNFLQESPSSFSSEDIELFRLDIESFNPMLDYMDSASELSSV